MVRMSHTFDVDDHAAIFSDRDLSYDQLGRGRFEDPLTGVCLPGI
jgi:hypothetical protein